MPRYIDIEQEIEQMQTTLNEQAGRSEFADYVFNLFIKKLKKAPTADVVPRSEVEELTKENESLAKTVNEASELIRKLRSENNRLKAYDEERDIQLHQRLVREAKQEVARELIDDIADFIWQCRGESFCLLVDGTFYGKEELKEFLRKKYIGE